MRTLIRGCRVLTPLEELPRGEVLLEGDKIAGVGPPGSQSPWDRVLEAEGKTAVPGLLDVHIQGAGGSDVLDAAGLPPEGSAAGPLATVSRTCARFAVTGFLATTVYRPGGDNTHLEAAAALVGGELPGAELLGLHLEGPFIAPGKRGMIQADCLGEARLETLRDVLGRCAGSLRMMTIAPELPGSLRLIEELAAAGVVASFGHSLAGYEETRRGIAAGISHATHLFNAMAGLAHRAPGPLPALWEAPGIPVQLIPDGVHVQAPVLRLAAALFGPERVVLITDGMQALGLPEGRYTYNGVPYESRGGTARYQDGTLIGTSLGLSQLVLRFRQLAGWSLAEAVRAATLNPARALGLESRKGSLAAGKDADVVLLEQDLSVWRTLRGGRTVYAAGADDGTRR
jgi:N-acetylglucosamine-6-phosphate deacetylase